jgi:hypothetical protein
LILSIIDFDLGGPFVAHCRYVINIIVLRASGRAFATNPRVGDQKEFSTSFIKHLTPPLRVFRVNPYRKRSLIPLFPANNI